MIDDPWRQALWGGDHNLLQHLINTEIPPKVLQNVSLFIYNLYQQVALNPELRNKREQVNARINQLAPVLNFARSQMSWGEQKYSDLALLQFIRINGGLAIALGAGSSIPAGAPNWSSLVKGLLSIALKDGHEVTVQDRIVEDSSVDIKRRVVKVERLTDQQVELAKKIVGQINDNSADSEILKEGAQLCADLFKESLFQHITSILYANTIGPGSIHEVVAKLAQPQKLPLHNVTAPGWSGIINYNFDSLIIDALEKYGIPYVFYCMRNGKYEQYTLKGESTNLMQKVIYLHGFTPRQSFFDIAGMEFVFSTRQYAEIYGENETIIDFVKNNYLLNPLSIVIYVGCSFTDSEMNNLLKKAIERYPYRFHYALLKLPDEFIENSYLYDDENEELLKLNEKYNRIGIQPIWISDYSEIPDLLLKLT